MRSQQGLKWQGQLKETRAGGGGSASFMQFEHIWKAALGRSDGNVSRAPRVDFPPDVEHKVAVVGEGEGVDERVIPHASQRGGQGDGNGSQSRPRPSPQSRE